MHSRTTTQHTCSATETKSLARFRSRTNTSSVFSSPPPPPPPNDSERRAFYSNSPSTQRYAPPPPPPPPHERAGDEAIAAVINQRHKRHAQPANATFVVRNQPAACTHAQNVIETRQQYTSDNNAHPRSSLPATRIAFSSDGARPPYIHWFSPICPRAPARARRH